MTTDNEVVLPQKAQDRLKGYIAQRQQMQAGINQYFLGVMDSLGLEGQWDLDPDRMVAVKIEQPVKG